MNNIMLDIETLGTAPGCVIISIAAVQFSARKGKIGKQFYDKISVSNSKDLGFSQNDQTMAFWSFNTALFEQESNGTKTAKQVLQSLVDWISEIRIEEPALYFWCKGASFDFPILEAYYNRLGIKPPWHYRELCCLRTIFNLYPSFNNRNATHNPVEDCLDQIRGFHNWITKKYYV